jgi:hypothetical protein
MKNPGQMIVLSNCNILQRKYIKISFSSIYFGIKIKKYLNNQIELLFIMGTKVINQRIS